MGQADKRKNTQPNCVSPNGYEVEEEEVVEHGSSGESEAFWSSGGPPRRHGRTRLNRHVKTARDMATRSASGDLVCHRRCLLLLVVIPYLGSALRVLTFLA